MSNFIMSVDFFNNAVRCETENMMVSLTDLIRAGNKWRSINDLPPKTLGNIISTEGFDRFVKVVADDLQIEESEVVKVEGRGNSKRTMAHLFIAVYVAEQISTEFHYQVIKTFVTEKLLEFRNYGSDEFKTLNKGIDLYLPGRELKKSNKGIYINVAKLLRCKILGKSATSCDWDKATAHQTQLRYENERRLVDFLKMGMVRDYDHLKEIIERI